MLGASSHSLAVSARFAPPRSQTLARKLGATFEPWDADRIRSLLVTRRYFQGLHDATGFQIHPLNLALALAADIEKRGALVETSYGKGRWVYVGLGLWRQLPAGTDGAYQLLANLISLPKAPVVPAPSRRPQVRKP